MDATEVSHAKAHALVESTPRVADERHPGGAAQAAEPIQKLVIAIHGIGSQSRSDTIRWVAQRFGDHDLPPAPLQSLGFFNLGPAGSVRYSQLHVPPGSSLARIGFAEVFWADIPREAVNAADTLEETKAWGTSVASRAHALYRREVKNGRLKWEDFQLGANVVDEIVEAVHVLERLLVVFKYLGLFRFELAPLLRDYLGDVQIVTEFEFYRRRIVARFHATMEEIEAQLTAQGRGDVETYIVAHSEGTVVSFLALLEALSSATVPDPTRPGQTISTDWVKRVRGFMTIGSPIDKHLVLWEDLWTPFNHVDFQHTPDGELRRARQIRWRNYYDFGDPIGFELDIAAAFLAERKCDAFEFDVEKHNFGFSRSWLPGKAHTDYWSDAEVFRHFIDDVVKLRAAEPATPEPPKNRPFRGVVSTAIPYALSFLAQFAAVFAIFKGITAFETKGAAWSKVFEHSGVAIGLLGLLLAGVTTAARLPRLVKTTGVRWHLLALVLFAVGAAPVAMWTVLVQHQNELATLLVCGAAVPSLTGWLSPARPRWGRWLLLSAGTLSVSALVAGRLASGAAISDPPVWPLLLGGAAFLYLWWLSILLFDLAFIWHRYIRQSVAVKTLHSWRCRKQDAEPLKWKRAR